MAVTRKVRRVVSKLEEVVHDGQVTYGRQAAAPSRVAVLLRPLLRDRAQEVFVSLLLDGRHRLFGYAEVSCGTITSTVVHPREVYGPAVRQGAAALICAHNHPSGDPEPSQEDLEITRRLIESGRILGIPVLDHLVIGGGDRFVSLRGRLDFGG